MLIYFYLIKVLNDQPDIFTNASKTKNIIQKREFWQDVEQLKSILSPAKNAIKSLEFNTTTLADCFLELLKMARAILAISPLQNITFKQKCTAIFNKRWKEFDINMYMLAFFLHPKYRGKNINIHLLNNLKFYISNIINA